MRFSYSFIKIITLVFCISLAANSVFADVVIGSWNLENFGAKKSDSAMEVIAEAIKDLDVVAVQEVLISNGGAAAVARLADALNRKGAKWQYVISDITTSDNIQERERYAFLWKPSRVKLVGKPVLATQFEVEMCREPYMANFLYEGSPFTLVNFHALPKKKQPEMEIRYLSLFASAYPSHHLIFLGDFNCPQSHPVFDPIKEVQYEVAFKHQKTTLKQACKAGNCLASEYDNIYFPGKIFRKKHSGIIPFYNQFGQDMAAARKISDHLPIFITLSAL